MKTESFASVPRKTIISLLIIAAFSFFGLRLFQIQVVQHTSFDQRSAGNSIKGIEQTPLRGVFYDRNLEVVVKNQPAYTLRITPADYDRSLNRLLETVIDADSGYIDRILYNNRLYSRFIPIRIKRGVDFKVIAWYEENSEHLPGVDYIVEMQRGYPAGVMGSHMFGYTKEISPAQLEREKDYYRPGDYVGHNGIEKAYENYLRGIKGYNYILVDSRRKEIGSYRDGERDVPSIKGHDLVLTIDAEIQRLAEQMMKGKRGAIVAIEPATGEILAMVSAPDYDLNQFSYVTTKEFLDELYSDPDKPSFNRATMSVKPPGSTYKMLSALAALDLGVINENTTIFCGGGFTYGRFFKCLGSHGAVNLTRSIEKSCNTFYYSLIYKIGLEKWAEYSNRMGFGKKAGIDIGEEVAGLIPNSKYYEKIYGANWPRSIMASLGIGQGEVSVSPLQLAQYCALIANSGKSFVPHLVKGYLDDYTKELIPFKFEEINTGISDKAFDLVREGMHLVVHGSGTATRMRIEGLEIAGKTGTAQNPHGKDHALFVGFAPYENPKIAVAVIVENVGFGGTHAAPIARAMFETYLPGDKPRKQEEIKTQTLSPLVLGALNEN